MRIIDDQQGPFGPKEGDGSTTRFVESPAESGRIVLVSGGGRFFGL